MPAPPLNVSDYEALAIDRLDDASRAYFCAGSGDEHTLRRNVAAFNGWHLRPRVLVDLTHASTRTRVVGHDLELPVIVAPMARLGLAHPDGDPGVARAAAGAGTVMCLSFASTSPMAAVADTGAARWQHIPNLRDPGLRGEFVDNAEAAGFSALVLTVDSPVTSNRDRARRTPVEVPPAMRAAALGRDLSTAELENLFKQDCSWQDLDELVGRAGVPVIVKGVLTPEDAELAVEHGAAGIIVSNHGGRQLDRSPATIEALPAVVDAVAGRADVLMDGGVRRGTDVVMALALGARATLIGRPALWGLAVDGQAGVAHVLELLRAEISLTLKLLGAPSPEQVTRAHVACQPPLPGF